MEVNESSQFEIQTNSIQLCFLERSPDSHGGIKALRGGTFPCEQKKRFQMLQSIKLALVGSSPSVHLLLLTRQAAQTDHLQTRYAALCF